jgi:hypothetical protein
MRDRSPIWIGIADLLLCVLSVVIVTVAPTKAKLTGSSRAPSISSLWNPPLWSPPTQTCGCSRRPASRCSTARVRSAARPWTAIQSAFLRMWSRSPTARPPSSKATRRRPRSAASSPVTTTSESISTLYRIDGAGQAGQDGLGLKCHLQIVSLNPSVRLMFPKDVVLNRVGQTINVVSFDMDRDGKITLIDPPLEPITAAFQGARP